MTLALTLGSMNHLGITVSDLSASTERFYGPLLDFLGYREVERSLEMSLWVAAGGFAVNLWQAHREHAGKAVERYAPGFHHFAFNADGRETVDRCYDMLCREGIEVTDAPADYDYLPGYYAVFFTDPDGLKFELVHIPPEALEGSG
jgi:catechol 2,3-dioxygenase-like lactoylglutathione lyase family enzyme